jgi:hypothetical protein
MTPSTKKALQIGGLIAGLGLLGYLIYKATTAGEEPPIRVKKGSMTIEILAAGGEQWADEQAGNWGLQSDGENSGEQYKIEITTSGMTCQSPPATAKRVVLSYSDGQTATFKHTLKKTKLAFKYNRNILRPNPKILEYTAAGDESQYVTEIAVHTPMGGEPWRCSLDTGQFVGLCLYANTRPSNCP